LPDTTSLNPIFRDLLKAFLDENVEFLVIGGYAVISHGYVRSTGDIDLWINATEANASRVWRALLKFHAPLAKVVESDFADPTLFYFIGQPPFRVDILGSIDGPEFQEAWERRKIVYFDEFPVPVLSLQDLIANKRAVGRPKDLVDIQRTLGKKRAAEKKATRKSAKKRKKKR
jgi:hypothetical protein